MKVVYCEYCSWEGYVANLRQKCPICGKRQLRFKKHIDLGERTKPKEIRDAEIG